MLHENKIIAEKNDKVPAQANIKYILRIRLDCM